MDLTHIMKFLEIIEETYFAYENAKALQEEKDKAEIQAQKEAFEKLGGNSYEENEELHEKLQEKEQNKPTAYTPYFKKLLISPTIYPINLTVHTQHSQTDGLIYDLLPDALILCDYDEVSSLLYPCNFRCINLNDITYIAED